MEDAGEGQQVPVDDSSAKEVPKRWGFRRSTIARREFMEEIGTLDITALAAPRRGARQARGRGRGRGKGKEAGETRADSPAPKRGRGGRKSAPANLSSVPSPVPPDARVTTDFGGGGSNCAGLATTQQKSANSAANPQSSTELQAASDIEAPSEAPVSDQAEDSDDLTLRELQERARNRRRLEEANALLVTDLNLNTNTVNKDVEKASEQKQCLQSEQNNDVKVQEGASSSCSNRRASRNSKDASKKDPKLVRGVRKNEVEEEEEEAMEAEDAEKSSNDSSEESDPNAIYCICRQKHNNRFMICCDRCQEWFHGDCVGITEARGRLLEKNGEDYICPTCSPCQSPVDFLKQPPLPRAALSSSSESLLSTSAGEDRPSEDEGIRGKIRKATTRSTKTKFKIFQTVKVEAAVLGHEKEDEEKVKQKATEEKAAAPKCIGPGCVNDALPESVYCGHQCIIRHAAVAMQTISEPKPQSQIQAKPAPKPVPKIQKKTFLEKLFKRKVVEKPVKEEECSSKEAVVSSPMEEPVAAPLSTDPEPKAPRAQESSAIAPSVFYKSTAIKDEKEDVANKAETKQDAPQNTPPNPPASSEGPEKADKTEKADDKATSSAPPLRKPGSNPLPSRAKKTMPGSPRLAGLKQLQSEPSQVRKSTFNASEKPSQNQEPATTPEAPTASSSPALEVRVLPVTPAPVPPPRPLQAHPNMQMRQNIRRSLTDALLKRVTESDELEMSESDVGKLAVNIEREMFNMFYTTDSKYKNKYRTLLLSLKDPRNKGLFYQVMRGHITPFKLTRLSQQELQGVQEIAATPRPLKEDPPPVCVNTEEPPPECEEKVVKAVSAASTPEEKASGSQARPTQPRKVSTAVSDIISSMLKDTTSEHKAHLFDLKCRICTGQISADEDPDAKRFKKEELKEEEEKPQWVIQMFDKKPPSAAPEEADPIMESPASPTAEDLTVETTSPDFSPMVIPEVSVVSITRRDPRTAGYRPAPPPSVPPAPAQAPAQAQAPVPPQRPPLMPAEKEKVEETKTVEPLPVPPPPPPPMPKSILMKPSAPSVPRFYSSSSSATRLAGSHAPGENETSQFLSKQATVWKGFLNMLSVAKFVTKAYLISGSGSAELLKKDLPDTIHIGGRILPQTVWEYVEKVKTSVTKELCLIRFHPATDEEEVAYVSLFSYFNSRRRFGVVSNICNSIKDLYLIPLCAKEPIPSLLLPLEGSGLEEQHPNLLLGLAICQKVKRPGAPAQEVDEKRPRLLVPLDSQGVAIPIKPAAPDVKPDDSEPYDPYIPISTTPPGSPPAVGSPDSSSSSSSLSGPSALSNILSVVNHPPTSSSLPTSSGATPLQTILNTLFGKKKQDPDVSVNTCEPSPSAVKDPLVSSPTFDPIVQQYQQTPKNTPVEKMELDDNDRPYDPEEEYDPGVTPLNLNEMSNPGTSASSGAADNAGDDDDRPYDPEEEYNLGTKVDTVPSMTATKSSEADPPSKIINDIAYDPEDETVFEEMQTYLADAKSSTSQYGAASTVSLSEQQRMLEELNRQIEEQKRQLEEQEEALRLQRAAVGVSMAHFSVSDALMSPPPRFGRDPEEAAGKIPAVPTINLSRDPRQCRNVRQDAVSDNMTVDNDHENRDSFMRNQALTQATFLEPSNNSVLQDMSKPEQEMKVDIVKKDSDMSSVTAAEKSTSIDGKERRSMPTMKASTHLSASELEESTQSSGNEKSQHSGSARQRHSSKSDSRSSPRRRSRHDRRPHHEERSSRASRDEADRHRRGGRHSAERSRRSRSRSRSQREERVSSGQRDHHGHRSTSRHTTRREHHSSRSRSTRSRRSAQAENDQTSQKEQSPSRQRGESVEHSTEEAQSANQVASQTPEIQGDELQSKASENRDQIGSELLQETENDQPGHKEQPSSDLPGAAFSQHEQFSQREQLSLMTSLQPSDFSQPGAEQVCLENEPASGSASLSVLRDHSGTIKARRYEPEVRKDSFAQEDGSELPPQMDSNACSDLQADLIPQSFQSEDASQQGPDPCHEGKAHTSGVNPLQRQNVQQDVSERSHHRTQPRPEHSLVHQRRAEPFPSIRDLRGDDVHGETVFDYQRDEQPFGSLQSQGGRSSSHEADPRRLLRQRIPQTHREGLSEHEQPYSRNSRPLSGPPTQTRSGHFSSSDPDLRFNREALGIHPSQGHRGNLPQDEAHQIRHYSYPDRPGYREERGCSPSGTDELHHSAEKYSGHFPLQETGLPYRPPHLQENDFLQPEDEETDFGNSPHQMPSQKRRGSCTEVELRVDPLHHRDNVPADIPRDLYLREQFRPRAPGDQWRGPPPRAHGPRGPPSLLLMTPRGPTAMRPRMPRAPHPERFENCGPGPNFGPRGPNPRIRRVGDAGPSPNFGPRGPLLGPGMFEGSEPRTFRPRRPSPDSQMFEEVSPQESGFKSRFPGPGISEGHRPQIFRPRGPSSGPRMFDGPRPGLLRSRRAMGGPSGLSQPRHEETSGLLDVGGPPHQQFDNGDSELPDLNDAMGHAAPRQFDKEPFEPRFPDGRRPAPLRQFDKQLFDSRDCQSPTFHGSRECTPTRLFDEAPPQCSDESYFLNPANESFSNPQDQRRLMGRRSRPQPRMCRSPSPNHPDGPLFPGMDSGMRGLHQVNEFGDQGTQEEMDGPHFAMSDVYEGGMNREDDGPRFIPPRNLRGPRAPSPLFPGQRMPPPRSKELFEDAPYPPHFPSKIAPTSTHLQRPPGPKGDVIPKLQPRTRPLMVQQPARFVGPPKEPDVRPLRLSGPLLPTPPGGPIRLPNPRMQRPVENRPQGPLARGRNAGSNPGRFDDHSNHPQRESSQSLIHERPRDEPGNGGEDSSSQDSSPVKRGKPWRRRARKREGRNRAGRKQRIQELRKRSGATARDRSTDTDQKSN
ncbi:uncharacterized protein [Salminus brasiliensis]|uniref:uncharacterized protein n=1 Tax=Salminus brasiliensis TaxID=930266 RepID=UPI003B833F7B